MSKRYNWKPVVRTICTKLLKEGCTFAFVDDGGEDVKVNTVDEAVDAICAVDEARLYVKMPDGSLKGLFIVLGNDPYETICDYHVDPILDKIVDEFAEEWEGKPCPLENKPNLPDLMKAAKAYLANPSTENKTALENAIEGK